MSNAKENDGRFDSVTELSIAQPRSVGAVERIVELQKRMTLSTTVGGDGFVTRRHPEGKAYTADELLARRILPHRNVERRLSAEFISLRNKLKSLLSQRQGRIVLTLGANRGAGATFCAANLAVALRTDNPVIMVDCDIESRGLSRLLDVDSVPGLAEYFAGTAVASDIAYDSALKNVSIIPAGKSADGTAETLSEPGLNALLSHLRHASPDAWIILDGPALSAAADNHLFTSACDCALLVVPYGKVTSNRLRLLLDGIDAEKVAGIAFNRIPDLLRKGP